MKTQSLNSNLRKLQAAQYRHDQTAHMDIAGLPVPQRVTHFTLHFAKYVGQLAASRRNLDGHARHKVIADSFVIVLAAANALNVDLQRCIEEGRFQQDTAALELDSDHDFDSILLKYAEIVGQMSKACEALDHMENFPSRDVQERGVNLLVAVIRRLAEVEGIDLAGAVKTRWKNIEQRPLAGRTEGYLDDGSPLSKVA